MTARMNIGEAARRSGVSAKMIRHYEAIGVVPRAARTDAGYRVYDESSIHTLRFLRKARGLGFSMKEIKKLVGLWRNRGRASSEVKSLALAHIDDLETKIRELRSMSETLRHLALACHGDQRPECPILEGIADPAGAPSPRTRAKKRSTVSR